MAVNAATSWITAPSPMSYRATTEPTRAIRTFAPMVQSATVASMMPHGTSTPSTETSAAFAPTVTAPRKWAFRMRDRSVARSRTTFDQSWAVQPCAVN